MEGQPSQIRNVLEIKNNPEDFSTEKNIGQTTKDWADLSTVEKKNLCFEMIVHDQVLQLLDKALMTSGLSEDQVADFNNQLANFNSEEINRILAIPYELRERRLSVLVDYYKKDPENAAANFLNEQLALATEHGFSLGYHVSSQDIRPVKSREGSLEWNVHPYELDDRVGMKMAYYSRTFDSMYLKKPFTYIYIIRSSDSHRKDNNEKWGYAPFLSVVDRIEMTREEADKKIDYLMDSINKNSFKPESEAA